MILNYHNSKKNSKRLKYRNSKRKFIRLFLKLLIDSLTWVHFVTSKTVRRKDTSRLYQIMSKSSVILKKLQTTKNLKEFCPVYSTLNKWWKTGNLNCRPLQVIITWVGFLFSWICRWLFPLKLGWKLFLPIFQLGWYKRWEKSGK